MEPNRAEIEDRMRRLGLEETEARAAYHLRRAQELFEELYGPNEGESGAFLTDVYNEMYFKVHFRALTNLLGRRVLARDYPEGWGGRPEPEEGKTSK